jgi:hypothetical protein
MRPNKRSQNDTQGLWRVGGHRDRLDPSHRNSKRRTLCRGNRRFPELPFARHNGEPTFIGTAPQSIGAQLEHRPTRESLEHAKKQAQAQILMVVTQVEALDSEGKQSECRNALAKAKLLLNP